MAAAITGLEPVTGATVELIRVGNDGEQIGDVLASTVTSITGDYVLTLPQGVNLAGNLVVRITGANLSMRAQVVEQDVDINPVSEFVLRKFVEQGADLDGLVVTDVVTLSNKVEEFDLTAGANLSEMFAKLEQEVGEFVESEIAVVTAAPGDASTIAGNYRSSAFGFDLHDSDNTNYGHFEAEVWNSDFAFAAGSNGTVNITYSGEESADVGLNGTTIATAMLQYFTNLDNETETFISTLTDTGLLSIQGEFEEDIEGNFGWRSPAVTYNLQKVKDKALFALLAQEAEVRYGTIDTNNDGTKDAVNPDDRQGDELHRTLEFFARSPSDMTAADLNGAFGRVYLETYAETGRIEIRAETTELTFNGDETFTFGATAGHSLAITGTGTTYTALAEQASAVPAAVTVTAAGDIETLDGPADGFINDSYDFISLIDAAGTNDQNGHVANTLMVKLPTSTPQVSGKTYRLMFLGMHLSGTANGTSRFLLSTSQLNSFVTMTSQTQASLNGKFSEIQKEGGLGADMTVEKFDVALANLAVEVAANGATTVTIPGDEGATVLQGFFNQDASMGIFTEAYVPTQGDIDDLGLAILIEVTQ